MIRMTVFLFIFVIMFSNASANSIQHSSCHPTDSKSINIVVTQYLSDKKNSAIPPQQWIISQERCVNDYALIRIHPKKPITDDAFIYLRKTGHVWNVLSMGTYFDDEFLRSIPAELRDYSK